MTIKSVYIYIVCLYIVSQMAFHYEPWHSSWRSGRHALCKIAQCSPSIVNVLGKLDFGRFRFQENGLSFNFSHFNPYFMLKDGCHCKTNWQECVGARLVVPMMATRRYATLLFALISLLQNTECFQHFTKWWHKGYFKVSANYCPYVVDTISHH